MFIYCSKLSNLLSTERTLSMAFLLCFRNANGVFAGPQFPHLQKLTQGHRRAAEPVSVRTL